VVEIGEVEYLEVDPPRSGRSPRGQCGRHLVGGAGSPVPAELFRLAPDRCGAPGDVGVVRAAKEDERRREQHVCWITIDGRARGADTITLRLEDVGRDERCVEL
jgi:hypothetical protein